MALNLDDKKAIVAEVNETAGQALSLVIADARGVDVSDMNALRAKARTENVQLRVIRNTLAKRAFAETMAVIAFIRMPRIAACLCIVILCAIDRFSTLRPRLSLPLRCIFTVSPRVATCPASIDDIRAVKVCCCSVLTAFLNTHC